MRWLILTVLMLCVAAHTILLSSTQAHAFGWYRTYGDYAAAAPGCYRFHSRRWNYAAAYYFTYLRYRPGAAQHH
jgi:hypothetical protein